MAAGPPRAAPARAAWMQCWPSWRPRPCHVTPARQMRGPQCSGLDWQQRAASRPPVQQRQQGQVPANQLGSLLSTSSGSSSQAALCQCLPAPLGPPPGCCAASSRTTSMTRSAVWGQRRTRLQQLAGSHRPPAQRHPALSPSCQQCRPRRPRQLTWRSTCWSRRTTPCRSVPQRPRAAQLQRLLRLRRQGLWRGMGRPHPQQWQRHPGERMCYGCHHSIHPPRSHAYHRLPLPCLAGCAMLP